MVKIPCRYSVMVSAFCPETTLNSLERMREPGEWNIMHDKSSSWSELYWAESAQGDLSHAIHSNKENHLSWVSKKNWEILPVLSGLINKFY